MKTNIHPKRRKRRRTANLAKVMHKIFCKLRGRPPIVGINPPKRIEDISIRLVFPEEEITQNSDAECASETAGRNRRCVATAIKGR